jgi:hypothetical protein
MAITVENINAVKRTLVWSILGLLIVLGVLYQAYGFGKLLCASGDSIPIDFRLRWMESILLLEGKDSHWYGHPDPLLPPRMVVQRKLGSGYPPWGTALGLILAPPVPWPMARVWFAFLNATAMFYICRWSYLLGRGTSVTFGVFLVAAVLACAPTAICLSYGQYSIIVLAALLLGLDCVERRHNLAAGLAFAVACVKPHLAAMPLLVILLRRQLFPLFVAGFVISAACIVTWSFTGIDPVTLLRAAQADARKFAGISVNPLTEALLPLLGFDRTMTLLGVAAVILTCLAVAFTRTSGRLKYTFAVSIIIAMFASYRKPYDVPLLILPMAMVLRLAADRKRIFHWVVALSFAATLWVPIRNEQWFWLPVQIIHFIVWSGCAVLLLLTDGPTAFREEVSLSLSPDRAFNFGQKDPSAPKDEAPFVTPCPTGLKR